MKKIFLFAAAAVAALTVNAKVIDLSAVGTAIGDWTIENATLNTSASDESKAKYIYDIKQDVAATVFVTAEPNVVYTIKNTSGDKAKAFSVYPGKCFEFGGVNGILIIKGTATGESIKLTVAAKGSTAANFVAEGYPKNAVAVSTDLVLPAKEKGAAGADENGYIWKELEFQSMGGDVEIKESAGGYRINKIVFEAGQGVENVEADVKAVKTFENGQLVIIKNGVKYNAIGAAL